MIKFQETEIGKIPEDWEVALVDEVARVNEASIGKSFKHDEIEYIDIDSVDCGNIAPPKKLKLNDSPSRAKRIVRSNDILISTVRPNLKHFAFVKSAKSNTIASTGFAVISSTQIEPRFLYYCLTTERYTNYLSAIASSHTSTYPSFNPDIIQKSSVPYPSIIEQRAIAKVLSDLDSKIELNREMNATLEAMAEALFKHWFVDFEFPDEKGRPYMTSGGKMVDSELGEIPKGWEVKTISDIAEVKIGRTPPRKESKWFSTSEGVKWVSIKDLGSAETFILDTSERLTAEAVRKFNVPIIKEGTVMLSFKLTMGRVAISSEDMVSNEAIAHFNIKNEILVTAYLQGYLTQFDYNSLGSTSSIATAINSDNIRMMVVLVPPRKLQIEYKQVIGSIFSQIKQNLQESSNVIKIRNSLLPRLMSGKIRVPI